MTRTDTLYCKFRTKERSHTKLYFLFSFPHSIGANDKLILNRTIKSIELRRKKLSEARQALYRAGQQKLREKITGDRNKRIRDHMKEVPQVNSAPCSIPLYTYEYSAPG